MFRTKASVSQGSMSFPTWNGKSSMKPCDRRRILRHTLFVSEIRVYRRSRTYALGIRDASGAGEYSHSLFRNDHAMISCDAVPVTQCLGKEKDVQFRLRKEYGNTRSVVLWERRRRWICRRYWCPAYGLFTWGKRLRTRKPSCSHPGVGGWELAITRSQSPTMLTPW